MQRCGAVPLVFGRVPAGSAGNEDADEPCRAACAGCKQGLEDSLDNTVVSFGSSFFQCVSHSLAFTSVQRPLTTSERVQCRLVRFLGRRGDERERELTF